MEELIKFEQHVKTLPTRVELIIRGKEKDPLSQSLMDFAQNLCEVSEGKITLTQKDDALPFPGLPALTLAYENRSNIHYCAVPEGHELHPFTQALAFVAQGYAPLSSQSRALLANILNPVELWVLVSPFCTNCPLVVETVLRLATTNPLITAIII
ncbi:MAG: hypothetical protein V2A69_07240, partial [Pseudomonadota bacterium]